MSTQRLGLMDLLDARIAEGGTVLDAPEHEEIPGKETPGKETPAKVTPSKSEETPGKETPAKATPSKSEEVEEVEEIVEPSLDDLTKLEEEEPEKKKASKEEATEDDDDEEEVPEEVKKQGAKSEARWKELRAAEKENLSLKAEIKTLRESAPEVSSERVKELEAKLAEQDKIIAAVSVTNSEQYQQEVRAPMARVEKEVKAISDGDSELENEIFEALAETNLSARAKKLSEITDDMPDFLKHKLYGLVSRADEIFEKDAEFRKNAAEMKKDLDRKGLAEKGARSKEDQQALEAAADTVWKNITTKIPGIVGEDGEVLPEFAEVFKKGRGANLAVAALGTQAFAAFATHLVPALVKKHAAERAGYTKRIGELEKSVARLTGSGPGKGKGVGVSGKDSTPGKSDKDYKPGSTFLESVDERFASGDITFG